MAYDPTLMRSVDVGGMIQQGIDQGRKDAQERSLQAAMAALQGPDSAKALQYIYTVNPGLGRQMEDQLYQRSERQRQGQFRTAASNMLLSDEHSHRLSRPSPPGFEQSGVGSAPVGQPPLNALNGRSAPAGQPTVQPASNVFGGQPQTMPSQASAQPATVQPAQHPDIAALDPHKINIVRGAELIRRIQPRDEAGWQQVRASAQQAGIDLTDVPEHFDPQYAQGIVTLADHFGNADQGAITVTGQRQRPANSPDYEAAVRADPEKFLTFQGNRLEVTRRQLEVARNVNNLSMQIIGGVHDQASYDAAKEQAAQLYADNGQDFSQVQLPAEYSPELIRDLQMKGMDTSKQLHAVAAENKLNWDKADDQADNARADRIANSQASYRTGRLKQLGQPRPRAAAAPKPSPPPTPNSVIGRIMDKEANGQRLSRGEQNVIDQYRAGKKRALGGSGASVPTKIRPNEPVSKLADGRLAVVRNGQWVPAER